MVRPRTRPPMRRAAQVHDRHPPIADGEIQLRKAAFRDGSERLSGAIDALVARTARRIDVPEEWRSRALDFARAYLGMEVAP